MLFARLCVTKVLAEAQESRDRLPHFRVTRGGFVPSWRYCMTHAGKPPDSMSPESAVLFCFFNAYCCICKRESTLRWRKQNCHLRTLADASCSSEHKVIWLLSKEAYFCLKFRSLSLSLSHTHTHTHTHTSRCSLDTSYMQIAKRCRLFDVHGAEF